MMKPSLSQLLACATALLPCLSAHAQTPCHRAIVPSGLPIYAQPASSAKRFGTAPYGACLTPIGMESAPSITGTLDGLKGRWTYVSDGNGLIGYAFDAFFGECPPPAEEIVTPMTLLPQEGSPFPLVPAAHTQYFYGLYFLDEGKFSLRPVKVVQYFSPEHDRLKYTDGDANAQADFVLATNKVLPALNSELFWGWYPAFSPTDPMTHNIIFEGMRLSIRYAKGNHRTFVTELVAMNGNGQRTLYRHTRPSQGTETEEARWPGNIQLRGVGDMDSDKRTDLILSYEMDGNLVTQCWLSSLAGPSDIVALAATCVTSVKP